jgi:hypothetical protein
MTESEAYRHYLQTERDKRLKETRLGRAWLIARNGFQIVFGIWGCVVLLYFVVTIGSNVTKVIYALATDTAPCVRMELVEKVGECDFLGKCSVLFRSGNYGEAKRPIQGQFVCLERDIWKLR